MESVDLTVKMAYSVNPKKWYFFHKNINVGKQWQEEIERAIERSKKSFLKGEAKYYDIR